MANQRESERSQPAGRSKREEREDRILDATAELIQRWGYNKVTIDDIARQARVAKGTIYLHWKTRDELFWSLLAREDLRLMQNLQQRIASDPQGISLSTITRHIILVVMENPLSRAMLMMDQDMLGELARIDYSRPSFGDQMANFTALLLHLREEGNLRADIEIKQLIYMLSAILMGFLMVEQWMPPDYVYSNEQLADMAADTILRTFESSTHAEKTREASEETQGEQRKRQADLNVFNTYISRTMDIFQKEAHTEEGNHS